jgi:hypothetical protein
VPSIAVLGPQQPVPYLADALDKLGVSGPVCSITAGWQEREGELDELIGHIDRPCHDLGLYQRADVLFASDQPLFEAHRARQDKLRFLQTLYRRRLDYAIAAARELMATEGDAEVVTRERRSAITAIRTLDRQHLRHIRDVHGAFDARWHATRHPSLTGLHEELTGRIGESDAVLIAGGHVSILINRLRLFGLGEALAGKPLVAWSAGAMALSRRVVLFHDSPPQGEGHAELLDAGLGLLAPLLPLPHADQRLALEDRERVALLARRFSPEPALTLDAGGRLFGDAQHWHSVENCRRLTSRGRVEPASVSDLNRRKP